MASLVLYGGVVLRGVILKFWFVFLGLGLLLCGSFIDNSRGPLLPILSHHFGISYQEVSWFLVVGYLTSVLSTGLLIPIYHRIGLKRTGLLACFVALSMGVFAQTVTDFPRTILLGIWVACGSSSLGALSNLFIIQGTPSHKRSQYFAALHTMYGLGSQAAPLFAAWVLTLGIAWNSVFSLTALPVLFLALAITFKIPSHTKEPHAHTQAHLPFTWFSLGGLTVLLAAFYVAAEVLTSNWMVTYLVEVRGYSLKQAAPYLSGYFWAIAITRALCFWVGNEQREKILMLGALVLSLTFFCLGLSGWDLGFALTGVLGPFFPLMLARMSRLIPHQAESTSIRVMAGMQLTLAFCNLAAGTLVDQIGPRLTYQLPALCLVGTLCISLVFLGIRPGPLKKIFAKQP